MEPCPATACILLGPCIPDTAAEAHQRADVDGGRCQVVSFACALPELMSIRGESSTRANTCSYKTHACARAPGATCCSCAFQPRHAAAADCLTLMGLFDTHGPV
eukprot:364510-Chlamydomonas_euryale.AAC.9